MTTSAELNASFDSMATKALRVKKDRDLLLAVCKQAYEALDDRYDVDQEGEHFKESPFNGAGELLMRLKAAIERAELP
jgi:hypothetical protein